MAEEQQRAMKVSVLIFRPSSGVVSDAGTVWFMLIIGGGEIFSEKVPPLKSLLKEAARPASFHLAYFCFTSALSNK